MKNYLFNTVVCLIVIASVGGNNSYGQIEPAPRKPVIQMQDQTTNSGRQKLDLAIQLVKRGAYMGAADLLEEVLAEQPGNVEVVNLLLNCYENLKAYEKAENLLIRSIEGSPFDYMYHDRILSLYIKNGVDSMVTSQIEKTKSSFPGNPDIYISIINKLIRGGYGQKADSLIQEGRKKFDSEILFAREAALLYESRSDYYGAALEYVKALGADSNTAELAERQLSTLVRYPGAPPEIIRALTETVATHPDNQAILNALQQAYIKDNRFDEAFDICLRVDSLTGQNGRNVFQYMRQCRERNLHEQTIRAAQYIENLDSTNQPFADYKFYYGEALIGLDRYDEALKIYQEIFNTFLHPKDKAEALLYIGNLYRYNILNYDSAKVYYDKIVDAYVIEPWYSQANYQNILLNIVQGDLTSAESGLIRLANKYKENDSKEMVDYQLAMIYFYQLDFEKANLAFRKIIATYPRGFYVNDALINSLIITENMLEFPEVLSNYATALYFTARLMADSVEQKYSEIINREWTPLTGASVLKLAELYASQNDTVKALDMADFMESKYAEDYFFPFILKLKADILLKNKNREMATELYHRLLENYSGYPFSAEIREIMQEIQLGVPTS
ncbi:MAG: tetratricopeptide repeat protein [Candidatus Zixiibacteriota bacterium]